MHFFTYHTTGLVDEYIWVVNILRHFCSKLRYLITLPELLGDCLMKFSQQTNFALFEQGQTPFILFQYLFLFIPVLDWFELKFQNFIS